MKIILIEFTYFSDVSSMSLFNFIHFCFSFYSRVKALDNIFFFPNWFCCYFCCNLAQCDDDKILSLYVYIIFRFEYKKKKKSTRQNWNNKGKRIKTKQDVSSEFSCLKSKAYKKNTFPASFYFDLFLIGRRTNVHKEYSNYSKL